MLAKGIQHSDSIFIYSEMITTVRRVTIPLTYKIVTILLTMCPVYALHPTTRSFYP